MNEQKTCRATRQNGQSCRAPATADGYCFAHSARLQEITAEGRSKGGTNSSNLNRALKAAPEEVSQILQLVQASIPGVIRGQISPAQGTAISNLTRAYVAAIEHLQLREEIAELESRADYMEQRRYKNANRG